MAKPKALTREQLQSRKERAVQFTRDGRGDSELADEIEAESLERPTPGNRAAESTQKEKSMATTKELQAEIDDQQERVDEAIAILEDAYTPEASREDLAEAAGNALDVLRGEVEEEEEEEEQEETSDQGN